MLNTAKELHIGIDLGLQAINSNRKLHIEPSEKDWVLNTVLMQEINNRINPKSNIKQEGFEDTFKRIDDLESIKVDTSEFYHLPIYKYSDKAVSLPLPADYYRLIGSSVNVHNFGSVNDPVIAFDNYTGTNGNNYCTTYGVIKLPSSDIDDYSDFKMSFCYNAVGLVGDSGLTWDEEILFDMNEVGRYADYINYPLAEYLLHGSASLQSPYSEGKFMFIRMVLDHVNEHTSKEAGVTLYWERYANIYYKDSFIAVVDHSLMSVKKPSFDPTKFNFVYLTLTGADPNVPDPYDTYAMTFANYNYDSNRESYIPKFDKNVIDDVNYYTALEKEAYDAATFDSYPVRIVKSSELNDLIKNYYGKPVFDSPLGVIRQGRVVVYHDGTFEFNRIDLEYYRRPKLINIYNNQGCEITSDSFRMELVDKTVQKLSARIQDPNYKNLLQENLILE